MFKKFVHEITNQPATDTQVFHFLVICKFQKALEYLRQKNIQELTFKCSHLFAPPTNLCSSTSKLADKESRNTLKVNKSQSQKHLAFNAFSLKQTKRLRRRTFTYELLFRNFKKAKNLFLAHFLVNFFGESNWKLSRYKSWSDFHLIGFENGLRNFSSPFFTN